MNIFNRVIEPAQLELEIANMNTTTTTTTTPLEPTAPMTKAVLDLLRAKGALTPIEAQGVLRCRSLSKRITELKQLGHKIVSELKKDTTGQRYARYHLAA